jgi:hypothetical protein
MALGVNNVDLNAVRSLLIALFFHQALEVRAPATKLRALSRVPDIARVPDMAHGELPLLTWPCCVARA